MHNHTDSTTATSRGCTSKRPASLHDSARGSPERLDGFRTLVEDINTVLGPCNGIDSEGIDVDELKSLMADYESDEQEWSRYAFADHSRAYTRNLVDRGNGKSNLVSGSWLRCSDGPRSRVRACVSKTVKRQPCPAG